MLESRDNTNLIIYPLYIHVSQNQKKIVIVYYVIEIHQLRTFIVMSIC